MVIICLFSLAVNNLAKAVFAVANISPTASVKAQNVNSKTVLVQVVAPPQSASIVVSSASQSVSFSSLCSLAISGNNSFVQSVAAINLNLPADCFSLKIGKSIAPAANLSVLPLASSLPQLVVIKAGLAISPANIAQMPTAQNIPTLPLAVVFILISVEVWERKNLAGRLLSNAKIFKSALTLHQLQMLRC